jgi:hypothetical protein
MQDGFFQKVVISMIIGACGACGVWFFRHIINDAEASLNGNRPRVNMVARPHK